jgi:predicted nuclease with TOPRIM domain
MNIYTSENEMLKAKLKEANAWIKNLEKLMADQDVMLERQTARIVDLQTHIENFDRGRQSAFREIAKKVKEMPWESDTKDSFLIWLEDQA